MNPRNRPSKVSAGLLMYRRAGDGWQVFLAHPGGPFFQRKDDGVWTIPKGLIEKDEDPLNAAIREFAEETGLSPQGPFDPLGQVTQTGGKIVHAWAFEGDLASDGSITSNTFTMEWPPNSGRMCEFPEIDRAEFFDIAVARCKINPAQGAFIDRWQALIDRP